MKRSNKRTYKEIALEFKNTRDEKVFADAIDRVSTVAIDKHRAIKLNITKNTLSLQVETTDGSSGDDM